MDPNVALGCDAFFCPDRREQTEIEQKPMGKDGAEAAKSGPELKNVALGIS